YPTVCALQAAKCSTADTARPSAKVPACIFYQSLWLKRLAQACVRQPSSPAAVNASTQQTVGLSAESTH
ncbi:hypothetical protein IWW45_009366, partial [Coemansia sp. RSA 485]